MLTYLLIKASKHFKLKLDQGLVVTGVTSAQFAVMNQIDLMGNRALASEVAYQIGSDKPTVSGIVHRLLKMALLKKSEHPTDGRSHYLSLTHEGLETLKEVRLIADALSQKILSVMDEKDQKLFQQNLLKIIDALED